MLMGVRVCRRVNGFLKGFFEPRRTQRTQRMHTGGVVWGEVCFYHRGSELRSGFERGSGAVVVVDSRERLGANGREEWVCRCGRVMR